MKCKKWTKSSWGSKCESGQRDAGQDRTQEEKQRTEGVIRASKDEKWISSWQQIGVSYDKCAPLYPQWEYSPVLSYQLPVPCSGPTDTRWPSVNQQVSGREPQTADSDRCSLSAPSSHQRIVIMVYSFILDLHKTLKGKEFPHWVDMNQAFSTCSNPETAMYIQWGNHTGCDREHVNVDTLSHSLRNDVRPIMRVSLKGPEI